MSVPIACGQDLSRPTDIGRVLQALDPDEACNVLEIGLGTGYQAAILSRLSRRVFSIDRFRTLVDNGRQALDGLLIRNVELRHSDGANGWPEAAPFERIVLNAAVESVPGFISKQLARGGILVAPIDGPGGQVLTRFTKTGDDETLTRVALGASKFLPLIPGIAREL